MLGLLADAGSSDSDGRGGKAWTKIESRLPKVRGREGFLLDASEKARDINLALAISDPSLLSSSCVTRSVSEASVPNYFRLQSCRSSLVSQANFPSLKKKNLHIYPQMEIGKSRKPLIMYYFFESTIFFSFLLRSFQSIYFSITH